MRPFDLVIFDCDGVLFDSKVANRAYYNDILARCGRGPVDEEEMAYVHMHTAAQSIEYLVRDHPWMRVEALEFAGAMGYSRYLRLMTPEPGFREIISEIRPPMRTAISTNRGTTMPLLREIFDLDRWFDSIVCALDVSRPKPHPEGVERILRELGVSGRRALYVGDSVVDEEVAERSGLPLVAYKNPSLNAMFHVKHFGELRSILRVQPHADTAV